MVGGFVDVGPGLAAVTEVGEGVTVPSAESKKEYDAMIREYSKSVRIDGFRAGHVPASVLERKFGDSLRLDVMGRVMEKAVAKTQRLVDTSVRSIERFVNHLDLHAGA